MENKKYTDVFFSEREGEKKVLATWVYSVFLLLSLLFAILAIPALAQREKDIKFIDLQLEGTSVVKVQVDANGLQHVQILQPKTTEMKEDPVPEGKPNNTGAMTKQCPIGNNYAAPNKQGPRPNMGGIPNQHREGCR